MISQLLTMALAILPPSPPGLRMPQPSPKASEFQASLGVPMSKPILVVPLMPITGFAITNIVLTNGVVRLDWEQGVPPFQVEGEPSLAGPWNEVLTNKTIAHSATFPAEQNHFWRVLGNQVMPLSITHTNPQVLVWEAPTTDMSDSLTPYKVQSRTTQPPVGQAPTDNTGWTDVTTTTNTTYPDPTNPGTTGIWYRIQEVTSGGVIIPYSVAAVGPQSVTRAAFQAVVGFTCNPSVAGTTKGFSNMLVAYDSTSGTIIVAGQYIGDGCTVGTTPLAGTGGIFIAKFPTTLTAPLWVVSFAPTGPASLQTLFSGLCVDSSGNIALSGILSAPVNFGGSSSPLTPIGTKDGYACKFDPTGSCVWARNWGAASQNDSAGSCGFLSNGDFVTTGFVRGTCDFGNGFNPAPIGIGDSYVLRCSAADGTTVWANRYGTASSQTFGLSIAIDSTDKINALGTFNGNLDFGNSTGVLVPAGGNVNGYLVQLNSSGVAQWSRRFGSTTANTSMVSGSMAVDTSGNVGLTGAGEGSFQFTGDSSQTISGTVSLATTQNQYWVAKYNNIGVFQWTQTLAELAPLGSSGLCVGFDNAGNEFFGGHIESAILQWPNPDGTTSQSQSTGVLNMYVLKSPPSGGWTWGIRMNKNTDSKSRSSGVTADPQGYSYTVGWVEGPVDFNPGGSGGVVTPGPKAGTAGFLLKLGP